MFHLEDIDEVAVGIASGTGFGGLAEETRQRETVVSVPHGTGFGALRAEETQQRKSAVSVPVRAAGEDVDEQPAQTVALAVD